MTTQEHEISPARNAFEAGLHLEVLENVAFPGATSDDSMALIGSLSFLGRLEEAVELWKLKHANLNAQQRARARFSIAIACTRISKFKSARKWLKENLDDPECARLPDTFQGLAVYFYYLGRFSKAASNGRKALRYALEHGDSYIHAFATDLYGHALVQTGRRSEGLQKLDEARKLARRKGAADPFTPAKLIYEAEAGLRPHSIIAELESMIEGTHRAGAQGEDTFTKSNLVLELARQLTLRGQWKKARLHLDEISQAIYGHRNRRQEATLQMRLAEIAYRQGDSASAVHFVQAARRCLDKIADHVYEIRILGLEHKIERKLVGRQPSEESVARLQELSRLHPSSINLRINARTELLPQEASRPGQDPLGDLLDRLKQEPQHTLPELISLGYLGLYPESYGLKPGTCALIILENAHCLSIQPEGVWHSPQALSAHSLRILKCLATGRVNKNQLIQNVWNYEYDPLRHDSIIYSALSTLRKSLGPVGSWVQTHDDGWSLAAGSSPLHFADQGLPLPEPQHAEDENEMASGIENESHGLNWRQIRALAGINKQSNWTVPKYMSSFKVSTMTAWRDLDGLTKNGYLTRIGRGRATVYLPQRR